MALPIPPKFAGLAANPDLPVRHTIELYLDYVCPFSAKQFETFYTSVKQLIDSKYSSRVQVIFRPHIQPWHPSSTLVHEAAIAVLKVEPTKFWEFSHALFKNQKAYFDENVVNETRNQTYARLAKLAASVGVDEKKVYDLLVISDKPGPDGSLNVGNGVTNDLKQIIKADRLVGVHVSPTVFFDGAEAKDVSSSFTAAQWQDWLEQNVA
ncbi:Thioredoxin-like fold protein [Ascosphaera apis ARSEF 7405]|uniref:Thioredoxin-like fold protein n=1 Tax=Ascosphaera apis ARSEF 7405 TaxID=392613 RepID=A0A167Z718_9EURO|nr:Thioredoxin-like fold protein [Ascosphaera apis ARSEF 7405]